MRLIDPGEIISSTSPSPTQHLQALLKIFTEVFYFQIWDLCIVHVLPWRPTSRVEPRGDVSHVRSDMV